MINLETIREALEYLEDTIVGEYIKGNTVFLTDSKVNEVYNKLMYTNDCLKYVPGFEKLKFSMFMRAGYSEVKDMKFSMVFKVNGFKTQKCNVEVPRQGFEYLYSWFLQLLNDFIYTENVISEINTYIRDCQRISGAYSDVQYVCDYTRKDMATVANWSYEKIVFGLGMNIVLKMRNLPDIRGMIYSASDFYSSSIKEMLDDFNKTELHQKCGAVMKTSIRDALCSSYKSMNDVIKHIMHNRDRRDVQNIMSCTFIEELGSFIVLCNWEINYETRKIDITIHQNKIYDIENDKFICRGDVYDRIDKRVQLPEFRSPIIFGDMTIEEFMRS